MRIVTTYARSVSALALVLVLAITGALGQVSLTLTTVSGSWINEVGWQIVNQSNGIVYNCRPFGGATLPNNVVFSVPAGSYEVRAWDSFGDTWNGNRLSIRYTSSGVALVTDATLNDRVSGSMTCPGPTAIGTTGRIIATFTVVPPCVAPTITQNPLSQSICVGQPVTFSVASTLNSGTFEWRRAGQILATTTSNTFTIPAVSAADAGLYDVVIRENCNPSIAFSTSASAQLTVIGAPTITQQLPSTRVVCENANDTLRIRSVGAGRTFQWFRDGVAIPGARDSSLIINNAGASSNGIYTCVVTGTCAPAATSTACTLSVAIRPRLTSEPSNLDICPDSAGTLTMSATGMNLVYQWFKDGTPVANATSPTLTFARYDYSMNGQYYCRVTSNVPNPNNCVVTVQTRTVRVSGYRTPTVTTPPQSMDACAGSTMTLLAEFQGSGLTYEWFKNGVRIPNVASNSLTVTGVAVTDAGVYSCRATGTCGLSVSTQSATVTVIAKPTFTEQPSSQTVTVGDSVVLSVNATDWRTIQWTKNGQPIAGATAPSFVIRSASKSDDAYYGAIVRNSCGGITTRNAKITVVDPVVPTPKISLGQTSVDFGDIPVGYDKTQTVANCIQSTGTAPLIVTGIAVSPAEYTIVNAPSLPLTVAPGTSVSISLKAAPTSRGPVNGTMIISSNDATSAMSTVSLTAAYVLRYDHASTQDFGTVLTDTTRDLCVTLTNTSAMDITIEQGTVTGADAGSFAVQTNLPLAIAAGQTGDVCVRFSPGTPGRKAARLNLRSSTGGNSSIDLSGTGEVPGSVIDASYAGISSSPNPMTESLEVRFAEGAPEMSVTVINATGSVVSSFRHEAIEAGGSMRWNGRDVSGAMVASGSYTMLISYSGVTVSVPVIVIR